MRAHAQEDVTGETEDVSEIVDLQFMEDYWREVEQEAEEYFPSIHWRDVFGWFKPGEGGFNVREIPAGLARFLLGEVLLLSLIHISLNWTGGEALLDEDGLVVPHREAENAYIVSRDDMDKTLQLISNCSLYALSLIHI